MVPSYRRVGTTDGGRLYFIILLTYRYRPRCMRLSSGTFSLSVGCKVAGSTTSHYGAARCSGGDPLPLFSFSAERKYNNSFLSSGKCLADLLSSALRGGASSFFEFRHFFTRLKPPRCSVSRNMHVIKCLGRGWLGLIEGGWFRAVWRNCICFDERRGYGGGV